MCERAGVQAGFINHFLCVIKLRTKMHVQSCVPLPLLQVPHGTVACSRTCVHVREGEGRKGRFSFAGPPSSS